MGMYIPALDGTMLRSAKMVEECKRAKLDERPQTH
jgi:hypothetical protein